MRSFWKLAMFGVIAAATGATTIVWSAHRAKANARNDAEDLRAARARAERGDAEAEYGLGMMYHQGRIVPEDDAEAFHWYLRAAAQGDAKPEYAVGYMYDTGKGVQQDSAEALRWYRKAADQGDRRAQCAIASLYYDGRGVRQDRTQAAAWYRHAAESGLSRAQYDLGYMYYYGQGVTQDRTEARRWFREALKQGDERARRALGFKLTTCRMAFLVFQTLFGFALIIRPLSLNMWEQNEHPRDFRAWLSISFGFVCLIDAGMGWWGYTHDLFWSLTYGTTGFILSKIILNVVSIIGCILLSVFFFQQRKSPREGELPASVS